MPHETYATKFGLRPIAYGRRGMVTTANPLATLAGVRMLAHGGNAVDAAIAAAAAIRMARPRTGSEVDIRIAATWRPRSPAT
jgi:gamma-glutamyltranspeptidase